MVRWLLQIGFIYILLVLASFSSVKGQEAESVKQHTRVVDKLIDLLPDTSAQTTEKIRLVLMLLPENYDYSGDRIIMKGRIRILSHELNKVIQICNAVGWRPTTLVMGQGPLECTDFDCCRDGFWGVRYWIKGTFIDFADSSRTEVTNYVSKKYLHIATGDDAGVRVTTGSVSAYLNESDGSYGPPWTQKFKDHANERFRSLQKRYLSSFSWK